jgi:hypothetical protein
MFNWMRNGISAAALAAGLLLAGCGSSEEPVQPPNASGGNAAGPSEGQADPGTNVEGVHPQKPPTGPDGNPL